MGINTQQTLASGAAPDPFHSPTVPPFRPWLHRFAMFFVISIFGLIMLGGTVTSKDAGLAVADYPTTFGYNMLAVPLDLWIGRGGIFWEHSHRLMGMVVGILAIVMLFWLLHTQRHRSWLRWLGVGVLAAVIIQGLIGGLRVTELDERFAIAHGIVAQLILCAAVLIAAATSRIWMRAAPADTPESNDAGTPGARKLPRLLFLLLGVLLLQLVLGATVRHTQAALAIPDFPTNYGGLVPPLTQASINAAIDQLDYERSSYFSIAQVVVHYAHRIGAGLVLVVAVYVIGRVLKELARERSIKAPAIALFVLLLLQILFGAMVIWSHRHAEIATAHQATGAAILATATLLTIRVKLACPEPKYSSRMRWRERSATELSPLESVGA